MSVKFKVNGNKTIEHDNIKAKIGLTDKKVHTSFYIEGGAFIKPEIEYDNFEEVIDIINKSCKRSLKKKLLYNKNLDTNFLMTFDVCSDRMKKDKNTYLSFQYHLKQKSNKNDSIIEVKNKNIEFFTDLLNDVEKEMNEYNIKISKNKIS